MNARALLAVGVLIAAAGLVAWWLRPAAPVALQPAPLGAGAPNYGFAQPAPQRAGTDALPAVPPAPAPATPPAAQAGEGESTVASPGLPAEADRRQDAKIARGLADHDGEGVLVVATPGGSIAGALHLLPGDLVKTINGRPVSSTQDFVRLYREEGLPSQVTVERDGREVHLHGGP